MSKYRGSSLRFSIVQCYNSGHWTLTGKMVLDLALIIINSKYKSKDLVDLPKVREDAVMMSDMLRSHNYKIKLYQDVEDIGEILENFQRNVMGREIGRLHFHFSGHGAKIHGEPDEPEKMRGGRQSDTKTTRTPDVGECLVLTTGELYAVHDLKRKLLECGSKKITISLDCSRVQTRQELRSPETKQVVTLKEKQPLTIAEQEKIAVISCSLDLYTIDSNGSLTRELHEVTNAGKAPILLTDIAKEVNASWKQKGIQQRSKIDLLEYKVKWTDYRWPSDKTQLESKKLITLLESLPLDGEIQCDGAPKSSRAPAYKQIKAQQTPTLSLKQGPSFIFFYSFKGSQSPIALHYSEIAGASAIDNSNQEYTYSNFKDEGSRIASR